MRAPIFVLLLSWALGAQEPAVRSEGVRPTPLEKAIVQELSEARWRPKVYVKYLKAMREYFEGKLLKLPDQTPLRTEEGLPALD